MYYRVRQQYCYENYKRGGVRVIWYLLKYKYFLFSCLIAVNCICIYNLFLFIRFIQYITVTDTEFRRIKEAFKRSAGANGTILSKSAFNQDVLCESVPPVVADWLYTACGGTSKGIPFKELLCGLVLLTRGTQEEKVK